MKAADLRQKLLSDFVSEEMTAGPEGLRGVASELSQKDAADDQWAEVVEKFLDWKQTEALVGEGWIRRMRWELLRFPTLLSRAGVIDVTPNPRDVTGEQIAALRKELPWEKATFMLHFAALRQFLAWAGNPVAANKGIWRLPSGEATHRRWLTKEQLLRLYGASTGPGRLLVALEGLNGLRRIEVLRLRAKDVTLDDGCLRVLGKGRNGGKWRTIPMFPACRDVLQEALRGRMPIDRLLPLSKSGADLLLARAANAAGLVREGVRVSHHDLRRTFGRLANAAGMDLIQLKNLFGHASLEMTTHYIGLDAAEMRAGLDRLSQAIGAL